MKNILITGASSGLGAALASQYAAKNVNLILIARNKERLEKVKEICTNKGAVTISSQIDVTDNYTLNEFLTKIDKDYPIDLIFANAGVSAGSLGGEDYNQAVKIFNTNILGVLNTIHCLLPNMIKRKKGQIAITSSLAGFVALPGSPSYSAGKAAVRFYGEALRENLKKHNIGVTVITPGYIKTPMTDVNNFKMPQLISSEKAANIIYKRLRSNPARIAFPGLLYKITSFTGILPLFLRSRILSKLPAKPNFTLHD